MPNFISEEQIEEALVQKLRALYSYDSLDCHTEDPEDLNDGSNRASKREVIFLDRLKDAVVELNKEIPSNAIDSAIEKFAERRLSLSLTSANKEIYELLRGGIPVDYDDAKGKKHRDRVRLIDFNHPENNRYLVVSQLWIKGELGFRRPDVLLYVNGIPLVFIELKNSNVKVRTAYDDNLVTYKKEIPQLFLTNAFCVLSNAIETRVGSLTAEWEHFFTWLRPDDEKEKVNLKEIERKGTSLERVIEGLLQPQRLLDYVENFILFYKENQKIVAQNHQFIGVNRAYESFVHRKEREGKLGVFWHTQGSGKSFSMIFLSQKIFRKQTGNFTFVVVTDREDLDGQIYRNFLHTGTVTKADAAQPKDGEEMRKFLGQNKRLVFTLIQKFVWPKGKKYPILSKRDDIIVFVDEAHRTQYKSLAENMRAGLPNAQYFAFTGTPLLGAKRKTNQWFGDYVSEYNFQQSIDDGATVPLFYSKRVPQVTIQNEKLGDEFYQILEDENIDDAQQVKLERKYSAEMEVLRRDDRLETIAKDIVYHFPRRGYRGKGLVVSVDKFTAVKMYDKVRHFWKEHIKELVGRIKQSDDEIEKEKLQDIVDYMRNVDMAVVVSEEADEEKKFAKRDLDIKPHRDRMNKIDGNGHDIEYNFKEEFDHPLQLVFVCAMWLTGFDAPTVSTLYLDKPMKDHTLMQAIARANRVTSWKVGGVEKRSGEIVDYVNIFKSMKKALKDYAHGREGQEEAPVKDKKELMRLLEDSISEGLNFCKDKGVDLESALKNIDVFKNIDTFNRYADILLGKDDWRKAFVVYENTIISLYEACKPEVLGKPIVRKVAAFEYLRDMLDSIVGEMDMDKVGLRVSKLLDESVVAEKANTFKEQGAPKYSIKGTWKTLDLSKLNFDKLREEFSRSHYKNIEISDLRAFIQHKLEQMLQANVTRAGFAERFQGIIDAYNAGSTSADDYFDELVRYVRDLRAEEERHVREGLTEDELELFDLLKKEKMTKDETQKVKLAAKSLLHRLREEKPVVLVQDWYRDNQTKQRVKTTVEEVLHKHLPESYDRRLFKQTCDHVFDTMLNYAYRGGKWVA